MKEQEQAVELSEEQARELWRRAAELQSFAERDSANARGLPASTEGLSLEQVAQAAEGAGIHPDYVRIAVAERHLVDADRIDRNLWSARWLRAILREPDTIELSQKTTASPEAALAALRNVVARPAFDLVLENVIGNDPIRDGVMVYRMGGTRTNFQGEMNWSDARVFLFTIRPVNGGAELRVRAPLYRRGINLGLTGGLSGLLGWGGVAAGSAASSLLPAAFAASALALAPVAIGGIAGATLGVTLYRSMYRSVYKAGTGALARLLKTIAMEAQAE